jgi:hypothetical protein
VNNKLLEYVAKGQAHATATGVPANIPPSLIDPHSGNFIPIVAIEIDVAKQQAELSDLGTPTSF